MNIAIFDSGIGGLSVLYQAKRMLPEAHFLYYADEDHVPYGEKTREQILTYTDEAVRFLLDQGADAIVLACNTATSVAAATLRDRYPLPIIGMEPAVKLALNQDDTHRVLVASVMVSAAAVGTDRLSTSSTSASTQCIHCFIRFIFLPPVI